MTLRAIGVSVRLRERHVLNKVSIEARPGEVTVILGPNGAGKTTLLRVLAGLLRPYEGRVLLDNEDVYSMNPRKRARRIAYMSSEPPAPGLGQSVAEYVAASRYPLHGGLALGPSRTDLEDALRALELLEIGDLADQSLGATSSGERQRAQLAHVLLREAEVLVVDEPTSFQDLRGRLLVYALLRSQAARGKTVIIASHDMTMASLYADHVIILSNGAKVAEGTPRHVLEPALLSRIFRVEVIMANIGDYLVPIPTRPL